MVGSHQDLELTDEGEHQALQVGNALSRSPLQVGQIISAPLRRTKKFADHILEQISPFYVPLLRLDPRLSELDYGSWSGKTSSEIEKLYGEKELHAWNERGEWPKSVTFSPSREQTERELASLFEEIVQSGTNTCLVSSQGRIKVIADILQLQVPRKMGTGRVSVLKYSNGNWNSTGWNLIPTELNDVLAIK